MMDTNSTSGLFRHIEHGLIPDPQEHRMAITCTPDGAGALIVSPATQKVHYGLWARHSVHPNDPMLPLSLLAQTLAADHLLPIPASATLAGHKVLLVPGIGFSADEIQGFFAMAFTADRNTEILTREIDSLAATAIFAEEKETIGVFRKHFPDIRFHHCATETMLKDQARDHDDHTVSCSLFLTGNAMFVHLYRQGTTRFFNSFAYQTTEELVYFMAAIARNLDVDTQSLVLKISGTAHDLPEYRSVLAPFFPLAATADLHPALQIFPNEQAHRFQLLATHLL